MTTTEQVSFTLRGRNPDVLTCIANLSNDEVFTPPELAARMLDAVAAAWAADHGGASLWANPHVRFLDPFTKSGVFLRDITTRLTEGLALQMPDLAERVNHILTQQVFGIGITRLTSLLARRSLYCSKRANGPHSVAKGFGTEAGNIWFERTEHVWGETKCNFCGAPRSFFERSADIENYAYAFIHAEEIKLRLIEIFGVDMQFDVIIGNPPYQMKGGAGGTSDSSIYHLFVDQAMNLEPKYLSMVIPARWMAGGRGLDEFRLKMLSDGYIRDLVDYPDSGEAFPGVQIKGGICYFLWDSSYRGDCSVVRVSGGNEYKQENRSLSEFDVLIRDERALSIIRKVLAKNEPSLMSLVSADTPFGIATNFENWSEKSGVDKVELHVINRGKRIKAFVDRLNIRKNVDLIDTWKVLVPEAYGAGETFPHQILGKEIVVNPPSVCTQSYLVVSPFLSEVEAKSFASYYRTRFFRFLVSLRKITQHALRSTYTWVPQQVWDVSWTDELLYQKYGITPAEIEFIEKVVRPMDLSTDLLGDVAVEEPDDE